MAEEQAVPVGDGVQCDRCEKLYDEIVNSFRVAIDQMKSIAAEGQGQEHAAKNHPIYNRYFGCAIAMDTLLREYFPERMPKKVEAPSEEAPANAAN